jgi:hypothetical protein
MDDALPDLPPVYHTGGEPPFDLFDPPQRPPERCVDPALWQIAHALHRAHRPDAERRCACGARHPCEVWWQAIAALHTACAVLAGAVPRLFALCDEDGYVIAYGMTLPDGSAVTVQWSGGSVGSIGMWASPGTPARLWTCGIAWLDEVCPSG